MSFQGQTDVTDTKHRAMIWDIITWWGLLTGISLLVRQEKRFFFLSFVQPCLVEMARYWPLRF